MADKKSLDVTKELCELFARLDIAGSVTRLTITPGWAEVVLVSSEGANFETVKRFNISFNNELARKLSDKLLREE